MFSVVFRWVLLNDCKHVVETTMMDQWLESDDGNSEIKMKVCPKCRPSEPNRNIMTTQRYMNIVKKTFRDIQAVKEKVYGQVEEIRNKRKTLLKELENMRPNEMAGFANSDLGELIQDVNTSCLPIIQYWL